MAECVEIQSGEKWYLIDFDDAMEFPQGSDTAGHLNKDSHAPEMFKN